MRKAKVFVVCIGLVANLSFAAEEISQAKVAELSFHRIERLVILEDIDQSFLSSLKDVKIQVLEQINPDDPKFYITASQYPGEDESKNELELWFNPTAQEVKKKWKFNVKTGAPANGAPIWPVPEKDAVVLAEHALHYILDNWQAQEKLKPYNEKLVSLSLSQVIRDNEILAQVDVEISDKDASVLRILIKTQDGSFDSAIFISPSEQPGGSL